MAPEAVGMGSLAAVTSSIVDDDHVLAEKRTLERLDEAIVWFDRKSQQAQVRFKWMKGIEMTAAASIPLVAANTSLNLVAAGLGVVVTVLEGLQHLNQYQHIWIHYRATCESLKHERYLYLAGAGVYANARGASALLAERVEALLSREVSRWTVEVNSGDSRRHSNTTGLI